MGIGSGGITSKTQSSREDPERMVNCLSSLKRTVRNDIRSSLMLGVHIEQRRPTSGIWRGKDSG